MVMVMVLAAVVITGAIGERAEQESDKARLAGAGQTKLAERAAARAAVVPVMPWRKKFSRRHSRARVTRFWAASALMPRVSPMDRKSRFVKKRRRSASRSDSARSARAESSTGLI